MTMFHRLVLLVSLFLAGPALGDELPPRITVLQYHHVSESTPASTSLSPERFAEHLQWLVDNEFVIGSLPEGLAHSYRADAKRPWTIY